MEKYLLKLDEGTLGLRFALQPKRERGTIEIGGKAHCSILMRSYLNDFFQDYDQRISITWRWSGKNKIRMESKCALETFYEGIEKLKSQGIRIVKVNSLGRIMR